ncbi:phosphoribosylglycinamide formyltransferase [Kaistia dalseonensis]|uniref:Phosphoribosylglycinamide formyltransferase n=1 Tax=Kaistia dalseonensis TaxID=410840 RepID=A0ABU0H0I4_9HYPH|nr:phosphoribosylglycinamide formyltransferase [Kaistia dalseonensis]MCX5493256.1 phosphoribosylglycinamide formyltransferase [Kaistia dalseonensis]MDQ0435813.1 phosphoribosylglycinamide formyltransferase-1 [Kaistia dalseonensis]
MTTIRKRVAILISGRGSNMTALIEAARDPAYPAEIALVLSNRADAVGLERARRAGIRTTVVDHRAYPNRAAFDAAVNARLGVEGIDIVCLAGFMRILTADFVSAWHDRMINIHPSLLPLFPGLHTHERAIEAGMRLTGCTVHFVRAEMDSGPIIGQAAVPIAFDDTPDTLARRVLAAEHQLYPLALALVAGELVHVRDERLVVHSALPLDMSDMLVAPAIEG